MGHSKKDVELNLSVSPELLGVMLTNLVEVADDLRDRAEDAEEFADTCQRALEDAVAGWAADKVATSRVLDSALSERKQALQRYDAVVVQNAGLSRVLADFGPIITRLLSYHIEGWVRDPLEKMLEQLHTTDSAVHEAILAHDAVGLARSEVKSVREWLRGSKDTPAPVLEALERAIAHLESPASGAPISGVETRAPQQQEAAS